MGNGSIREVCIVGMGYVGLTLAAAFLSKGVQVHGIELNESVRRRLNNGEIHLLEPGVAEIVRSSVSDPARLSLRVSAEWPHRVNTVVICVGTPYDRKREEPRLEALTQAVEAAAQRITDDGLLVIRSTVPVGTTRSVVLPILARYGVQPHLAVAPERTIQGKALEELMALPQVIGTDDSSDLIKAKELFSLLGPEIVPVSSYEAAELIKLVCNAYTDVRYGFGNEVALLASGFGLDAHEIIAAANHNYPRPAIARPGYVGGSCLTKDPYHLMHAAQHSANKPCLIAAARTVNESLPDAILNQIEQALIAMDRRWPELTVTLSGLAYKGEPETDDLRGSMLWELLPRLKARGVRNIMGHDFVLDDDVIRAQGLVPAALEDALSSDLIMIMNDHRRYQTFPIEEKLPKAGQGRLIYDVWGVYKHRLALFGKGGETAIRYMGVGFGG
ncbi:MAG: nucleotide sugar dehydrogenase [Brevibacillus sp.]|nr:nucleotide sugar dehydrogenase [Brevibacillus sp.]